MDNFRIAVKAFIAQNNKVLLLKRRTNDSHKPNTWDIPGGRLAIGENPFDGLMRETKEETNLEIEIVMPIDVHHFTRDDNQKITMIIFLCKPRTENIILSEEHQEYRWLDLEKGSEFPDWLRPTLQKIKENLIFNHQKVAKK